MSESIYTIWSKALILLKPPVVTQVAFDTNISKLTPVSFSDNVFILKVHEAFYKDTITQRYLPMITFALKNSVGHEISVKIISDEEIVKNTTEIKSNSIKPLADTSVKSNIQPKYVFDTFVRGKSNDLAYSASVAVAEKPGFAYNPLFLYGGVGLGKTHLMHSIGNYVIEQDPSKKVLYCSSETFTNELITSIRENKNKEFRNKFRDIDVLLIDDIQFLSDKEQTQEEFFHTFNDLYNEQKQIVISSDKPPKEIRTLEDRLRSRFSWGLITDLTLPDFETRTAILEKKAESDNLEIPHEVTMFISKNVISNIRDLEGALNKVAAYSKLRNAPITIELAESALKDIIGDNAKKEVNIPFIQEVVSNHFNITPEDIRGKSRDQEIALARQISMYLSRKILDIPLSKIGESFNGLTHSTIIHGCKKIDKSMSNDPALKATVEDLESKIRQ